MFFSELYGFGAMVAMAKQGHHILAMIGAITLLLALLSIIFYRFVSIYQSMKYEGVTKEKEVYSSEIFALVIFALGLLGLLMPQTFEFLKGIL